MKKAQVYETMVTDEMEIIEIYNSFIRSLNNIECKTKKEKVLLTSAEIRNLKIAKQLRYAVTNDGFRVIGGLHNACLGLAFELACAFCGKSTKTTISKAGRDNIIYIGEKGFSLECKVNGGELNRCFSHYNDGRAVNEYVAYYYDVCNSTTNRIHQVFYPRLIPMVEFVEFFYNHPKAYKIDEKGRVHIQPSNADFKHFIDGCETLFEFDMIY